MVEDERIQPYLVKIEGGKDSQRPLSVLCGPYVGESPCPVLAVYPPEMLVAGARYGLGHGPRQARHARPARQCPGMTHAPRELCGRHCAAPPVSLHRFNRCARGLGSLYLDSDAERALCTLVGAVLCDHCAVNAFPLFPSVHGEETDRLYRCYSCFPASRAHGARAHPLRTLSPGCLT